MTKQNAINLVPDYPSFLEHHYGYGDRCYNGTVEKSFSYTVSSNYELCRYASIASPAQYDTYELNFLLKAGTYSFTVVFDKGASRGVASFYLDDALLGSVDCYASATAAVNRVTYTATISTSGSHTFKVKVLSKNASSSGYSFACTGIFASPVGVNSEVRINCGGNDYRASNGKIWEADKFFSGGSAYDIESYIGPFNVSGTNDPTLYKFERSADPGSFSYTIPISSGTYNLNLYFCENNKTAAGQRVGTLALNGSNLLTNFDVFAQTGGQHIALIKSFSNLALTAFTLSISNTLIDAIELIRIA